MESKICSKQADFYHLCQTILLLLYQHNTIFMSISFTLGPLGTLEGERRGGGGLVKQS